MPAGRQAQDDRFQMAEAMKNIVLIGFMGTGKSSVGRILAKRTKRELIDLDRYLEEKEKRKIREIFEKEGESYFRKIEKAAVQHWAAERNKVIAAGGGLVVDPENVSVLKENGILITLVARPETIHDRVKRSKNRPLLSDKQDLLSEIKKLLEIRKPFYGQSDYYFDTDGKNASQVAGMILRVLAQKGIK